MFKRTETIKFSEFMSGEYNRKGNDKKERRKANKVSIALTSSIPLFALAPKAFAASPETVLDGSAQTSLKCMDYVASANIQAVPVNVGDVVGEKLLSSMAHLFDPLIDLIIGISFPVASVLILFKLFMGFFQDQGQVWEGVGKVAIVYILIQLFPVFSGILKTMGNMV
ncbi:hypothetical protein [Fictibacillus norfolkensis]|uniref:Uncharacterized protein n=1 Tax=Fictibacillus norfolkensis TaxID=2762233 RepID=A0ABR8SRY5_9BACL|nr:hypothetical protein [Fictibacillus norfolkensis]MBD7966263.1 hypothetical protein [Fictibacillus norfolkensis]